MAFIDDFDNLIDAEDESSSSSSLSSSSSSSEDDSILYLSLLESRDDVPIGQNTIVRMDYNGNLETLSHSALFANTKEEAKWIPGGSRQISEREILVSDPVNKRAFLYDIIRGKIVWVYRSDRPILDCYISPEEDMLTISLTDESTEYSTQYVSIGTVVIWENNRTENTTIYSGETTFADFQEDPDLNKYGNIFKSQLLAPGERFAHVFGVDGEYYWFEYSSIATSKLIVAKNRVSSNTKFVIVESDGLESPYTGRIVQIDTWGNEQWSFGTTLLVKPTDANPLVNNKVIISV